MLSSDPMKLKRAIVQTEGNLTRAAYLLDVSKAHVMALARRWGLNNWARDIRIQYGHSPAGRPRIIT